MPNADMTDPHDLTRTQVQLRAKIEQIVRFFVAHVPGFKDAFLISSGPHIGIRETRHIAGEYRLVGDDLWEGRRFDDEVLVQSPSVDIHTLDGSLFLEPINLTSLRVAAGGTLM